MRSLDNCSVTRIWKIVPFYGIIISQEKMKKTTICDILFLMKKDEMQSELKLHNAIADHL